MVKSVRIPEQMQPKFDSIRKETDAFCDKHLNDEYKTLVHLAIAALSRKRPSPLLKGKENSWAAGIVHALGMINFLFDKSQIPYCAASEIYSFFGVSSSAGQGKSKETRDLLKMSQLSPEWMLPSRIEENPLIWMISVNGMIIDVRNVPLDIQEMAFKQGLIPYVPASKVSG